MKPSLSYSKVLLLVCCLIHPFITIHSEITTWQISGIIVEAQSNNSIPHAHITLESGAISFSDSLGHFNVKNIQSDSIAIIISHTAYNTTKTKLYKGRRRFVTIALTPKNILTNEVKILAVNPHLSQRTQTGVHTLSKKEILNTPAFLGEADVVQTLKQLPGIQSANEGNSGIYVRGGSAGQNYVSIDNIELLNPSHVMGIYSVFNPLLTHEVEVYKGTAPAYLNSRQSSTIIVNTPDNPSSTNWNGNIGNIASNLTFNKASPDGKWYWHAGVRRSFTELFGKAASLFLSDNKNYFKQNKYRFYDFNSKIRYLNKSNKIILSFYNGFDKFDVNINKLTSKLHWGNLGASLKWQIQLGNSLSVNNCINYSNYVSQFSAFMPSGEIHLESKYHHIRGQSTFTWHKGSHLLKWGIKGTQYNISPQLLKLDLLDSDSDSDIKYRSLDASIFLCDAITLSDKWQLYVGAVAGYYSLYKIDQANHAPQAAYPTSQHFNILPQVRLNYKPDSFSAIKAAYNYSQQNLHYATIAAIPIPSDVWIPATKNLRQEYGHQASIGYFKTLNSINSEVGVDFYGKQTFNQLMLLVNSNSEDVKTFEDNFAVGKSYSYGGEFLFKGEIKDFKTQISYTLAKVKQRFDEINKDHWFDATYDRRHELKISMSYPLNKRIEFYSRFTYATGNKATLPTGRYLLMGQIANDYTEINNYRLPSYQRLDVAMNIRLNSRTFKESIVNISIINLYNRANPFFIYYDIQQSEKEYQLSIKGKQISLFPILPSISWRFKF